MKTLVSKLSFVLLVLCFAAFLFQGCKSDSDDPPTDPGNGGDDTTEVVTVLSGQVISQLTGIPLENAEVIIFGLQNILMASTDTQGNFTIELTIPSNMNITLVVSREGYYTDSASVFVYAGSPTRNAGIIELTPENTGTIPSGDPVSIFLKDVSSTTIGVTESGSEETARLFFEVQDSAGIPIDLNHSVTVNFRIGTGPGGGEFISPTSVPTNNNGEAAVNLTSGIRAGTVQVIATINVNGEIISSLPVGIAIHGGLPDQTHFSIAPQKLNFAGYNIYGLKDPITAYVGDKYANPVRPETAVYFTSTGGIIVGSTITNEEGIGSVSLISAAPQPNHEIYGPGFATVTASTIDETSNIIKDSILVLFSGYPVITCSESSFNIPNAGSQTFYYTISDQNSNPLEGGTQISVNVDGNLETTGDDGLNLPDTQSRSWTQFSFMAYDSKPDTSETRPASITITTSGPNGRLSYTIYGTSQ